MGRYVERSGQQVTRAKPLDSTKTRRWGGGGLPDDGAWSKTILESEHSWLNLGVSIQNRVKNTKGRMLGYAELAKTQGNTQTIYTRK